MKIPNDWEPQQIAFDHSSDIQFRDFINLYKKCTSNPYYFLVIDVTLHNHLHSERKKIKTNHDNLGCY